MRTYLLKRLLLVPITLFGISIITFLLIHMAPGDPASIKRHGLSEGGKAAVESQRGTVDAITKFRERYGLHLPLHEQYLLWLKRLVVDRDLGETFNGGRRVWDEVKDRIVITASLEAAAFLVIFLVAIPTGIWSAWKPGSPSDRLLSLGMFVLYSLPAFWVATMLILLFGNREEPFLGISFPVAGLRDDRLVGATAWETVKDVVLHAFLPVVCLSYGSLAAVSRYMRTGMLEVIRQDYVRTARAKGLRESAVVLRHALRNAAIPIVTVVGNNFGGLLVGAVLTETVFGLPGLGREIVQAIGQRDRELIAGGVLFMAGVFVLVNLLVDLTYALFDPRVRYE